MPLPDMTFDLLSQYASSIFKRKFKRDFLFDNNCIAKEIKYHTLGWLVSCNYPGVDLPPEYWFQNGGNVPLSWFIANVLKGKCETIDIFENDAYDTFQQKAFGYFDAITYKKSEKDPYYNKAKKPQRKASYSNSTWKKSSF